MKRIDFFLRKIQFVPLKISYILLFLLLASSQLFSLKVPFSEMILQTQDNYVTDFIRVSPDDSEPVFLLTEVWFWHDRKNLYFYWEVQLDEYFEKGRMGKRDEWIAADFLRVQLITDVKNYYAYMFYTFPLGNKYDGIRNSNMNIDSQWNSDYTIENEYSDSLWKSTIKIPFKDLRFYGKPPYRWKVIFTRFLQEEEFYYSNPYVTTEMGKDYFRNAKDIIIEDKIEKNRNYKITPYYIKKYDMLNRTESFDPENVGMDFSFNLSSATKAKISINPDFSDVPMDSERDNFNIRYAPWYEENRFFFVEDLDVFGVDNDLFYSRHIMQPQYAVKMTGNTETFSYGFLSAKDKKISEEGDVLNSDDVYNMLAFKPKWDTFSLQMTILNRMNKQNHNEVFFLHPNWEFIPRHYLWSQFFVSINEEEKMEKGYRFSSGYRGKTGDFNWSTSIFTDSPNFAVEMGRVYETNFSAVDASVDYSNELNKKFLKNIGVNIWYNYSVENVEKSLYNRSLGTNLWASFTQKFNINSGVNFGDTDYENTLYNWTSFYANYSTWYFSWLGARINYNYGKSLVWNLSDTYNKDFLSFGFWGTLSFYLDYDVSIERIRYFGFPAQCDMDDEYWIGNLNLTTYLSNLISLTNGLRYNNYHSVEYVGFFSNFRYEFKENCNLYLGFKTAQIEIEQNFRTVYKQAYMKINYTF